MHRMLVIVLFLIFSCDNDSSLEKHGCLDSQACNYDPAATTDLFPETSCLYIIDCNGVCGGDALDTDNDGLCDE